MPEVVRLDPIVRSVTVTSRSDVSRLAGRRHHVVTRPRDESDSGVDTTGAA
jgi:hypothetical protein